MNQLELDLRPSLTVQYELDLDYTESDKPRYSLTDSVLPIGVPTGIYNSNTITSAKTVIQLDGNVEIRSKNMPWYRKLAFKTLGFDVK